MRKGGRGRILEGERIQEANQPPSSGYCAAVRNTKAQYVTVTRCSVGFYSQDCTKVAPDSAAKTVGM
eukprot:133070-Rhodomonas_salina.3